MNLYLIITGLLLFAALALWRREWGIYLIILLLPSYQIRFAVAGIPMTFLEGMILSLAAVEFISLGLVSLRGPRPGSGDEAISLKKRLLLRLSADRNDKITLILIFFFLLSALLSIFVSPLTAKAAGIFKAYFLEAMLFYFLVRLIIDTPKKLAGVWKSLALLVLYLSIFGIYQFLTLSNLPFSWWAVDVASRRITSLLNHPNGLALLLGPILAMLIMRRPPLLPLVRGRIKEGVLYWAAIIFGIITLYLTFSRAAWLALIVTIIAITLISPSPSSSPTRGEDISVSFPSLDGRGKGRVKKVISYALLVIVIILAIPFSRGIVLELLRGNAPTQQNRYVLWSAATDILKKSPIYGVGLMGFREAYKNYPLGPDQVVQNYPHNFFLNFWVEIGLVGLLAMLGLLYLFYRKIFRLLSPPSPSPSPQGRGREQNNSSPSRGEEKGRGEKSLALAAAAGMTMIILHGLVDVSYFKNDLAVLFWLIYALPNLNFLTEQHG